MFLVIAILTTSLLGLVFLYLLKAEKGLERLEKKREQLLKKKHHQEKQTLKATSKHTRSRIRFQHRLLGASFGKRAPITLKLWAVRGNRVWHNLNFLLGGLLGSKWVRVKRLVRSIQRKRLKHYVSLLVKDGVITGQRLNY